MGLIGDDDDVVPGRIRLFRIDILVELLDERKDERLVQPEHGRQMLARGGAAGICIVVGQTATGKGFIDLGVKVITVRTDKERKAPGKFAMYLLGEEGHGIGLAASLGVPENTQLPQAFLSITDSLHGPVDSEKLMIAGNDLDLLAGTVIEQDEVFEHIHEGAFGIDPLEQRLHAHYTWCSLFQAFPFVEMFITAGE